MRPSLVYSILALLHRALPFRGEGSAARAGMGEAGVIGGSLYSPLEAISRGTEGSNPSPSSRQSVSLPQPLLKVENPAFRAGLGSWLADRVSRDSLGVSISRQPGQYLCRAIFQYRGAAGRGAGLNARRSVDL